MTLNLLCSIAYDCQLLPYFLRYYSGKGVGRFIFNVWDDRRGVLWCDIESKCHGFDVILIEQNEITFNGESDASGHNQLRQSYINDNDWYVICDLDEFHDLNVFLTFQEAVVAANRTGASAIGGMLLDRVSINGHIPPALDLNRSLGSQFPITCNVTGSVVGATREKILMARKDIEITPGHHKCEGVLWCIRGRVHHFKWFGRLIEETLRRTLSYERQGLYYKNEPRILFDYLKTNRNAIPIYDPALNAMMVEDDPLVNLMAAGKM